jgi:Family of unknown function (DUF5941)
MSASAATPTAATPARTDRPSALLVYRDDGPLATALGALGRAIPLPPLVLVALAVLPLLVAIALEGDDASDGLAVAVTAWVVLLGGASSGRPHTDRVRWMVPALLRAAEYGGLIWFAALAGAAEEGAAFALLGAIAFRQYDLVYRLRHMGRTPPAWLNRLSGGWDGRLVVMLVLLLAGALPGAYYVVGAVLGVVFVAESVQAWTHFSRAQRPVMYEDEEDEGQ